MNNHYIKDDFIDGVIENLDNDNLLTFDEFIEHVYRTLLGNAYCTTNMYPFNFHEGYLNYAKRYMKYYDTDTVKLNDKVRLDISNVRFILNSKYGSGLIKE